VLLSEILIRKYFSRISFLLFKHGKQDRFQSCPMSTLHGYSREKKWIGEDVLFKGGPKSLAYTSMIVL